MIDSHKPTYRYKPVPVSALAIYHSPRKSLESQLQRSLARQAGGASRTGSRGNRILPAPDVGAATLAARAPAQVAVRTFIVKVNEAGFRNREIHI